MKKRGELVCFLVSVFEGHGKKDLLVNSLNIDQQMHFPHLNYILLKVSTNLEYITISIKTIVIIMYHLDIRKNIA
jgi:hypothetical protein